MQRTRKFPLYVWSWLLYCDNVSLCERQAWRGISWSGRGQWHDNSSTTKTPQPQVTDNYTFETATGDVTCCQPYAQQDKAAKVRGNTLTYITKRNGFVPPSHIQLL